MTRQTITKPRMLYVLLYFERSQLPPDPVLLGLVWFGFAENLVHIFCLSSSVAVAGLSAWGGLPAAPQPCPASSWPSAGGQSLPLLFSWAGAGHSWPLNTLLRSGFFVLLLLLTG